MSAIMSGMTDSSSGQSSRRILVLGSEPHSREVTAYTWDNLPSDLNVADYDVVIMNFVPLDFDEELTTRVDSKRLPRKEQFSRLLISQGSEVVAIGHPGTYLSRTSFSLDAMWWLPLVLAYTKETGDVIRDIADPYAYYLDHVDKWYFYWTGEVKQKSLADTSNFISNVGAEADHIRAHTSPIAQTRFHKAIAIRARLVLQL
jgi:hypothetical protein